MMNNLAAIFWKTTRRIASMPANFCSLLSSFPLEDVYLSTAELTIDSSTRRHKSISSHAFTPPPKSLVKTKRAASFFVPHRRDWIEFTRVRSPRCTSQIAIFGISRESSCGGTLERLLYIYYWSAISDRRSNKIGRCSLFEMFNIMPARERSKNILINQCIKIW